MGEAGRGELNRRWGTDLLIQHRYSQRGRTPFEFIFTDRAQSPVMTSQKIQFHHVQSGSMLELVHCGCGTILGDFDRCVCEGVIVTVVVTQAAVVTDAWDPSASRCLTCLWVLLSTACLVYVITLAAVHGAKGLAAREMMAFA